MAYTDTQVEYDVNMGSESIIDSRLFIRLDLSQPNAVNSSFSVDRKNIGHLANQLLLYDRIVIPTYDFGIVPILISWLGLDLFEESIGSGAISLLRRRGLLGYAGNGNGISTFVIKKRANRPFKWWAEALFAENQVSLDLQLRNSFPSMPDNRRERLHSLVHDRSSTLTYDNDFFKNHIVHESYVDVIESPRLSRFALQTSKKKENGSVDLAWLNEVGPDELRVLRNDGMIKDAADLVLRVAEVNMEILMAVQSDNADLLTSQGAEELLTEKLARSGISLPILEGFVRLLELNEIPDIGAAVSKGEFSLSEVWRIRQSRDGSRFRQWLRMANPEDSRDLEKAYVHVLGESTLADSLPIKVLRFALTTAATFLLPVLGGIAVEAVDSFFVDKWLEGYSPKLFMDKLQRLTVEKQPYSRKSG